MIKFLIFLVTLTSTNHVNCVSPGICKDIPVNPSFDVGSYVGKWYQIEKVNAPFEPTLKCVTATYSIYNASAILVDNKGLKPDTNEPSGINGYAWIPDMSKPNLLKLQFPNIPTGTYQVLETDYTGYTLIYSCSQLVPLVLKQELTWILARTPQISQELRDHLRQVLKNNNINTGKDLVFTDQINC